MSMVNGTSMIGSDTSGAFVFPFGEAFRAGATVFVNVTEYSRPLKVLEDATCCLPSAKVTC